MSVKLIGLVLDSDIPKTEKWTLVILADRASHEGDAIFYKIETIAKRSGLSERSVQRTLRSFTELGLIVVTHEATPRSPATYKIDVDMLEEIVESGWEGRHPVTPGDTLSSQDGPPDTSEVTPSHPRDDTLAPDTSFDPSLNPLIDIWIKALAYIRTVHYPGAGHDLHRFDETWPATTLLELDHEAALVYTDQDLELMESRYESIVINALIAAGQRVGVVTFTHNSLGTE